MPERFELNQIKNISKVSIQNSPISLSNHFDSWWNGLEWGHLSIREIAHLAFIEGCAIKEKLNA